MNPHRRTFLTRCAAFATTAPFAATSLAACDRPVDRSALRLGYFANITHAPALTGLHSGRYARALGGAIRLEPRSFNAGPAAMGALLGGAIDMTFIGPNPVLAGYLRSRGYAVRVVAGASSGGALFVVQRGRGINGPADLRNRRVATPQLGGTQDIALRHYLSTHGLTPRERGGDVHVVPLANPDALAQFRLGNLDGAWVPEPWAARMILEGNGDVLLDERALWPAGRFATTLLAVRSEYLRDAPDNVARFLRAHVAEVAWLRSNPADARVVAGAAIARILGRALPPRVVSLAWEHLEFTTDPLPDTIARQARAAQSLGFLPPGDTAHLVDPAPLHRALALTPTPPPPPQT